MYRYFCLSIYKNKIISLEFDLCLLLNLFLFLWNKPFHHCPIGQGICSHIKVKQRALDVVHQNLRITLLSVIIHQQCNKCQMNRPNTTIKNASKKWQRADHRELLFYFFTISLLEIDSLLTMISFSHCWAQCKFIVTK